MVRTSPPRPSLDHRRWARLFMLAISLLLLLLLSLLLLLFLLFLLLCSFDPHQQNLCVQCVLHILLFEHLNIFFSSMFKRSKQVFYPHCIVCFNVLTLFVVSSLVSCFRRFFP